MVGTHGDSYTSRSIAGIFLAISALPQFCGAALAAESDNHGGAYWNPEISALAISQDGDLVAASGVDGAIHIWDAKTGALRHRLWRKAAYSAPRHVALPVAFQPQGDTLAAAGDGQSVGIWDVNSGALERTLVVPGKPYLHVTGIAFTPDGERLATCTHTPGEWPRGQGTINIWDMASGQIVETPSGDKDVYYNAIAVSPDGKWLAAAYHHVVKGQFSSGVKLWDMKERRWAKAFFPPGERSLRSIAFSRDSRLVAVGGGQVLIDRGTTYTGEANVWNVETGALERSFAHAGDGGNLAVSFSPDGLLLAGHSAGYGQRSSGTRLWEVASGRLLWAADFPSSAHSVVPQFFSTGKTLLACDGEAIRLLNVDKLETKVIFMRVTQAVPQGIPPAAHANPVVSPK